MLCIQVREIYETAIEAEAPYGLPDTDCKKMCLRSAASCTCRNALPNQRAHKLSVSLQLAALQCFDRNKLYLLH